MFREKYKNFIPRKAEKLNPLCKLLKAEFTINITSELKETFDSVFKGLSDAFKLALKQPIQWKLLLLMTDASFRSAGYAFMIEDNPNQKIQWKRKTNALLALDEEFSHHTLKKMDFFEKKILGDLHGFSRLCAHFVPSNKTNNCLKRQ